MEQGKKHKRLETDVLIVGAGAVGCAIARDLSKYKVKVLVVDRNLDVGGDASKSNSAIIHTGYDATPGTLESQLVVAANPMYDRLTEELEVPFKRVGAVLPAFNQEQFEILPQLKEKAFQNGVYDVEYLSAEELRRMEPNLNPSVLGGLYIPREGIVDPFLFVVALAESAQQNGADFLLGTNVIGMTSAQDQVTCVETTAGDVWASYVVNAAGLYNDEIAGMVGKADYYVSPRKGQFFVLDRETSCRVNHIVLPIPTKTTKGKLMCPTVHGNMLLGPTAEDLSDKLDKSTDAAGLNAVAADVRAMVPCVQLQDTITQYAGLRPQRNPEGLRVDRYPDVKNFLNLSGVRSTGLTASVSLGNYAVKCLEEMGLRLEWDPWFEPRRKAIPLLRDMPREGQERIMERDPLYRHIICRCETVTEGEIVAAIHRPIPARSVDAVKRRLRAGMGRCQGGFCGPQVIEILARELGVPAEDIQKNNPGSYMIVGKVR